MRRPPAAGPIFVLVAFLLLLPVGPPAMADHFGEPVKAGVPTEEPDPPCECQSGQCPCPRDSAQNNNASQQNTTLAPPRTGGNPVDAWTGRKFLQIEDLVVPGVVPIRITRQYNSQSRYDSPLGYGWNFTYDTRLFQHADGTVTVRSWEGRRYRYKDVGSAIYDNADKPRGGVPQLEINDPITSEGVQFELTYQSGEVALFDTDGLLYALETPEGNRLRFLYSAQKEPLMGMSPFAIDPTEPMVIGYVWQLLEIKEQLHSQVGSDPEEFTNRAVFFDYYDGTDPVDPDTVGRVKSVTSHDGRTVLYAYDELESYPPGSVPGFRGNLAQVTGAHDPVAGESGIIETYRYPATPAPGSSREAFEHVHNLTYYDDGEGTEAHVTAYEVDTDRVDTQFHAPVDANGQPVAGSDYSSWDFSYTDNGDGTRTTTIERTIRSPIAGDTTATTVYTFNQDGFLIEKTDANTNRLEYDLGVEPLSASTTRVYEAPGDSSDLIRTIDFNYGTAGRLSKRSTVVTNPAISPSSLTVHTDQEYEGPAGYYVSKIHTYTVPATQDFITEFIYPTGTPDCPNNVDKVRRLRTAGQYVETSYTYDPGHCQIATVTPPAVPSADHLKIRNIYYTDAARAGRLERTELISDDGSTIDVKDHLKRSFDYDAAGNLASIEDARGHVTSFAWDGRGRLIRRTEEIGGVGNEANWESTLFRYGAPNEGLPAAQDGTVPGRFLLQVETGATGAPGAPNDGHITRFVRDGRGRITQIEQEGGGSFIEVAQHKYDSDDNRVESSEPTDAVAGQRRKTTFTYDGMGQLTSTKDDADNLTEFQYDPFGNRTQVEDARDQITDFVYDELNRLVQVIQQGESLTTSFGYDAEGNVTTVQDPKSQETVYEYDSLSQLDKVTQQLGQAVDYDYDDRGRLTKVINARGEALLYEYASWGGLESIVHDLDNNGADPGEREIEFTYDDNGNVASTTDANTQLWGFTYDALNRVDTATAHYIPGTTKPVLDAGYDPFGNRTSLELADSHATSPSTQIWGFDDRERMDHICMPQDYPCTPGQETIDLQYYDNTDIRRIVHGNGAKTDYVYHDEGPVDILTVVDSADSQLHKLDYAVDAVLNVDALQEWNGTVELERSGGTTPAFDYTYDNVYRLIDAKYPDAFALPASEDFAYDAAGNREDGGDPAAWDYDANNRIEASPGLEWLLDADGNTCRTSPNAIDRTGGDPCANPVLSGEVIYDFDAGNRLRTISSPGTSTVAHSYQYDPMGRRISKTTGGTTTWYLWDGDQLLAEYDGTGARLRRYAYGLGFAPTQLAEVDGATEAVYEVHRDHLDTPRMLTNSSETAVWRSAHAAFGESTPDTDPDGDGTHLAFDFRFPGQHYDAETGLHYNYFRSYDPVTGRYLEVDPFGQKAGTNLYVYVESDPLNRIDPKGLHYLLSPTTGGYRPHTHDYPVGTVDFSPRPRGMLDPSSPDHYQLPNCYSNCEDGVGPCLLRAASSAGDCAVCAASRASAKDACARCAAAVPAAAICMAQYCEEGRRGLDGECRPNCELDQSCECEG